MAGYICKIVLEDTHPPVWRRVVVPERITFAEMHEIIQVIFGWEDEHLHDFSIPADHIRIDDGEEFSEEDYNEKDTLVGAFFNNYKWIRYTYDFGDDWRHKINIEKKDDAYDKRYATLLKFKGNNFMEDSGGVWYGENQETEEYNVEYVNRQLEKMLFTRHDELQEEVLLKDKLRTIQEAINKLFLLKYMELSSLRVCTKCISIYIRIIRIKRNSRVMYTGMQDSIHLSGRCIC